MTEYDKFAAFFRRMGIEFVPWTNMFQDRRHGQEPVESVYLLTVSQTHFCFDENEKYIGVVSDETGHFKPRRI